MKRKQSIKLGPTLITKTGINSSETQVIMHAIIALYYSVKLSALGSSSDLHSA